MLVDPDVFAVSDIWELLTRDMRRQGDHVPAPPAEETVRGGWATSVMLLDCAKLKHWRTEEAFDELFAFNRDYRLDELSSRIRTRSGRSRTGGTISTI